MQLLGRMSELADLVPSDGLRDEVCFSYIICCMHPPCVEGKVLTFPLTIELVCIKKLDTQSGAREFVLTCI